MGTMINYSRLLSKSRRLFSRQEASYEQPGFTGVNEDFEQIFDKTSEAKAMVLKAVYDLGIVEKSNTNRPLIFIYASLLLLNMHTMYNAVNKASKKIVFAYIFSYIRFIAFHTLK